MPNPEDIDLTGMNRFTSEQLERMLHIDAEEWRREIIFQDELFLKLYAHLPKELIFQRELLVSRL